ncbi:NYN domain-containing protein [Nocardioides sp.]|uniref:NYN domain-containing protein n=1 Tax=Nocardioides sp. TaxID=35761 RepID=UPI003D0B2E31
MTVNRRTLGVLIDAEKVGAEYASPALAALSGYGEITMKRAYADWGSPDSQAWARELARHAIAPMQQNEVSAGRHSNPTALVIHALDLQHADVVNTFAIVCEDDSYLPVAQRLRANGAHVIGVGGAGVTAAFADACDSYLDLEGLHNVVSADRVARAAAMRLQTA